MSGLLVSILLLLLCAAIVAPLALAFRFQKAVAPVLFLDGALFVAIAFYYLNPFEAPLPGSQRHVEGTGISLSINQCESLLNAVEDAGVFMDRSQPSRPVVRAALWSQLPTQVRQLVTDCLDDLRSPGARVDAIEVIER